MSVKLKNNARSHLAASITTSATVVVAAAGEGARFPTLTDPDDWFPLVIQDSGGNIEYLRATARSGDAITVSRAQEGSAAVAFAAGAAVELRITAAVLAELANINVQASDVDLVPPTGMSSTDMQAAAGELLGKINDVSDGLTELGESLPDYPLAIAHGGTGAETASAARTALGLGSLATQDDDTVDLTGPIKISGTQVLEARQTGWSAATGTATRSSFTTYPSATISNPPTQAQVQALNNHMEILSERMKALLDDMIAHGLIGA